MDGSRSCSLRGTWGSTGWDGTGHSRSSLEMQLESLLNANLQHPLDLGGRREARNPLLTATGCCQLPNSSQSELQKQAPVPIASVAFGYLEIVLEPSDAPQLVRGWIQPRGIAFTGNLAERIYLNL